ncbi:MAG TPA: hypothetical protein VFY93_07645 [Planctomycetota bacterium]|nr:hypothetical protein [Planctomycetota bacterium]
MRSLLVLGAAAAGFALFLLRNEREAQALVRAETTAMERAEALADGPPGPPRVEGGYRFAWAHGGELPALLVATPEGDAICMFAAAKGAVYAYDLFEADPPDVTPLRVHVLRGGNLPAGWRKVR